MISHSHNFIYFRNPKTASHAILKYLDSQEVTLKNIPYNVESESYTGFLKTFYKFHLSGKLLKREIDKNIYKDYFKFCFVRNPWDKMVSMWRYMERHTFLSYVNSKSFTGFARRKYSFWDKNSGSNLNEYVEINKLIPDKLTFDAFLLYIFDSEMKVIFESGSSFSKNADFIGKYENLKNDFDFICDKLKLPRTNLDVANKSDRNKDYRVYYNNRTRDLVGDAFSEDIINFNYSF